MYGGRAIDNFDRRILNTYMDEYMGDFIFDTFQPFHFYCNEEVDYKIPDPGMKDQYTGELIRFGRYYMYITSRILKSVITWV